MLVGGNLMIKYFSFTLILLLMISVYTFAQEEKKDELKIGWNKRAVGTLNFTQASFDNWAAGGENSWSWLFNLTGSFINKQEKGNWRNFYKLEYGQSQVGDTGSKKTTDEIFLESEYTRNLTQVWGLYVAVNGRSQFAPGYDYGVDPKVEISQFFNPAYFRESFGLKYTPSTIFNTRAGFGLKQTVVSDEKYAPIYTDKIDTGELEKLRNEIGLESVSNLALKIKENITFASNLDIFSNLISMDQVDVRWDNLISAEVIKYISVSFNFQLYYDKDLSLKRQLKQYLAVGLTYSLL
jgi:Protein of unknown function (DUF3078)/Protein of unknown function, DUF481